MIDRIISVVQTVPIYLTFDIDCLDQLVVFGTGTSVIGRLTISDALQVIRNLNRVNIVGFDLVEVTSLYDCLQIIALTVVILSLEILYIQIKIQYKFVLLKIFL